MFCCGYINMILFNPVKEITTSVALENVVKTCGTLIAL